MRGPAPPRGARPRDRTHAAPRDGGDRRRTAARVPGGPFNAPITLASALHVDASSGYARDGLESWAALEDAVGALDGGRAVAFSSGLAACSAVLAQVPARGTVVAARTMYMGARQLIEEAEASGRLVARWVDLPDTALALDALPGADLLWIEAPQNPLVALADVPELCARARRRPACRWRSRSAARR